MEYNMFFCVFTVSHDHGNPITYNIHKKRKKTSKIRNISFKYLSIFAYCSSINEAKSKYDYRDRLIINVPIRDHSWLFH